MKIKRRFPNFFSGFEDEETEHEVNSYEELIEIPWIKAYKEIPNHMGVFYAHHDSQFEPNPDLLMALTRKKNGEVVYFVVGYIYGNGAELELTDYLEQLNKE
jgi:hypothetical protein